MLSLESEPRREEVKEQGEGGDLSIHESMREGALSQRVYVPVHQQLLTDVECLVPPHLQPMTVREWVGNGRSHGRLAMERQNTRVAHRVSAHNLNKDSKTYRSRFLTHEISISKQSQMSDLLFWLCSWMERTENTSLNESVPQSERRIYSTQLEIRLLQPRITIHGVRRVCKRGLCICE